MNRDRKLQIREADILWLVVVILLTVIRSAGCIFVMEPYIIRNRILNGRYAGYHNQPNNIYHAPVVYYRSDLERTIGVRLQERETELGGYSCVRYWNNGTEPTQYDRFDFYIFDSGWQAEHAFEYIKENAFYEITDEGDCYVKGWLSGVMDADIEQYYYINGNLIVTSWVTSIDESARPTDDLSPSVIGGGEEAKKMIQLIEDHF